MAAAKFLDHRSRGGRSRQNIGNEKKPALTTTHHVGDLRLVTKARKCNSKATQNKTYLHHAHSYHVENRLFYSQAKTSFRETVEISVASSGNTKATKRSLSPFHRILDITLAHRYFGANFASRALHSAPKCEGHTIPDNWVCVCTTA